MTINKLKRLVEEAQSRSDGPDGSRYRERVFTKFLKEFSRETPVGAHPTVDSFVKKLLSKLDSTYKILIKTNESDYPCSAPDYGLFMQVYVSGVSKDDEDNVKGVLKSVCGGLVKFKGFTTISVPGVVYARTELIFPEIKELCKAGLQANFTGATTIIPTHLDIELLDWDQVTPPEVLKKALDLKIPGCTIEVTDLI